MSSAVLPSSPLLYVSYTCPFAHRVLLARALLGLEQQVPLSVLAPYQVDKKWAFIHQGDKRLASGLTTVDSVVPSADVIGDVYQAVPLHNWDKVNSIPYLIDTVNKTGVSNGSADIVALLLKHADAAEKLQTAALSGLLTPPTEQANDSIKTFFGSFRSIFSAGASKTQEEYDEHVKGIHTAFAGLEEVFKSKKFLGGDSIGVSDLLVFPFVFRWDYVYTHISKYYFPLKHHFPHVARWVDDFIAVNPEAVQSTIDFDHIETGTQGYLNLPFTPRIQRKF